MGRIYITVNQAASRAHVSTKTVRRWYREGKLTKYRVEGRVLIDAQELENKIARQPSPAATGVGA